MRSRHVFLAFLTTFATGLSIRADTPHPLRLVPGQANLVLRVEKPRELVQLLTQLPALKELQTLPFVREQLESPTVQRFFQLVAYYEQDLGLKWPEVLDKLAGNGITIASKVGEDNAPALLIIHGTDPDLTKRFLQLAISVIEQELIREESKERIEKGNYKGIEGYKIGGGLWLAQVGTELVLSNKKEGMSAALDRHADPKLKSLAQAKGPAEARKAIPANSFAWLWLDLDVARTAPNAKELFAQPSNDVIQTVTIGGWVDVIRRSPFLAAALQRDKDTIRLSLHFPGGGYKGSPEQLVLHVPPKSQGSSPPLLEPKGVMLSQCFWFDFKALWEQRAKLFNDKIAKDFEEGIKKANPFLPGTSVDKLFMQAGAYHRFVAAHQDGDRGYKTKPGQYIPAFAIVSTMRDKQFARSMEGVLRGVALLTGFQVNLKLVDEVHHGVKIVGYRFPEDGKFPNDPENLRFNFSPSMAAVGDQFIVASTIELCRELIDIVHKEQESSISSGVVAPLRLRLYSSGGAELLNAFEDQVLGQIVLDQAVPPAEAKKQLEKLRDFARRFGTIEVRSGYAENEYRFNIEWKMGK